jgi:hypothetical protein
VTLSSVEHQELSVKLDTATWRGAPRCHRGETETSDVTRDAGNKNSPVGGTKRPPDAGRRFFVSIALGGTQPAYRE